MHNRAELEAMLQARLDLRYQQCTAARAKWEASSQADQDKALAEWDRISDRAEATRKAMIRVREGMPYWRWAAGRDAELAAAGYQVTKAGAYCLPAGAAS
jgi:hypothetical protein